jgi:hypothetical protein
MKTTLIAQRLQDPQVRKLFADIHASYREIGDHDCDCNYLVCTHSLVMLDAPSILADIRRVIDLVTAGKGQRLEYAEVEGEPMRCFLNVANVVELDGGRMRPGWLVSAFKGWTGSDLCWHAAWQRPDGDVLEVTPGYQRCLFVPSDVLTPTTFTARTFSSVDDLGRFIGSKVNLVLDTRELRDDGYVLQSGMPVDLTEAVRRAKLRAYQQTLAPTKSRFKQRKRRR